MTDAGNAIRVMRKAQSLTLRDLARLADVSPGYLSRIERGERTPEEATLRQITGALGRHMAEQSAAA